MSDDWKNNPKLSQMDPQKLSMLQNLADQGLGKNPSELMPFIMGAASQGKNAADAARLDRIVNLMKMIRH